MLNNPRSYEEACRTFRWRRPDPYNLAFDVCDRQTMGGADPHRTALIVEGADGSVERHTFHVLRRLANRMANLLTRLGIGAGDRVALALPGGLEAAAGLLGVLRMGAIVVPIPPTLGAEPLAWRLADSGARALLIDPAALPALDLVRPRLPELRAVLTPDGGGPDCLDLWPTLGLASDSFVPNLTGPDHPALLVYPVDGAGRPPGIVLAHRAMTGGLPAIELALGCFPQFGDVAWSPAEWMCAETLLRIVLPAWHHGVPVVAAPADLDPERSLALIGRHGIRAVWLPPALVAPLAEAAAGRPFARPRALASGPDPLSAELHETVLRVFGQHINEAWGVTESGAIAANLAGMMELRPPSPGRTAPGVRIEATDEYGRRLPAGERGILAVSPESPGSFLGYWGEAEGPARRVDGWLLTGRLGRRDLDNYLWPEPLVLEDGVVRLNDRRVRLDEIEQALAAHPSVQAAGVIDLPEGGLRAFVVPAEGAERSGLGAALRDWLTLHRGRAELPRRIELCDTLPNDAEGTIDRAALRTRPLRLDAPAPDERWISPR